MQIVFIFFIIANSVFAKSIVPHKVVTPPLDIFSSKNKFLEDSTVEVAVTHFYSWGVRQQKESLILSMDEYTNFSNQAKSVLEMIPKNSPNYEQKNRRGTAFHIGNNLALTNHHVLDPDFNNTKYCDDFQLRDFEKITYECQEVHFCDANLDVCLIEMKSNKNTPLAQGHKLPLLPINKDDYLFSEELIMTAIGNSYGKGIHLSRGKGLRWVLEKLIFYAPITKGNSGGPLLDESGQVIGVVKMQSRVFTAHDPNMAYNVAAPISSVLEFASHALKAKPEIYHKLLEATLR